jgi:hypothetical protein
VAIDPFQAEVARIALENGSGARLRLGGGAERGELRWPGEGVGIATRTAVSWVAAAGGNWTRYAADRARREPSNTKEN